MFLTKNYVFKRFLIFKPQKSRELLKYSTSQKKNDPENNKETNLYDVIITGGGMVGTALAAAIGHNNVLRHKRVLLLESGNETRIQSAPEHFSSAVCALSHSTKKLLHSFGAWDQLLRFQKVNHMRVWDSCSDVGISFDLDSTSSSTSSLTSSLSSSSPSLSSLSELAYIAENDMILSAITTKLYETDVDVKYKSKVESYDLPQEFNASHESIGGVNGDVTASRLPKYPSVLLDNGESYSAKLLVAADGSNSLLRRTSNIKTIGWAYNQTAVVATVKINEDRENNTAWQRFLKNGPIALLPLSDEYSCLIWTTSNTHAKHLLSLDPQAFVNEINHAYCGDENVNQTISNFSRKIEELLVSTGLGVSSTKMMPPNVTSILPTSRQSFPLSLSHADHYVKHRIALIGDAAHRVHPLSGQGVNLGFGDVTALLHTLQEAVLVGSDIGNISNLLSYERQRQCRVLPMMTSIDLFNRFYSNHLEPLVLLRSIGCQMADSLPFVKKRMIQFAIG